MVKGGTRVVAPTVRLVADMLKLTVAAGTLVEVTTAKSRIDE